MANPRKFSEKIALHNQKQAEETAAFEAILRDVSVATRGPTQKPYQQHLQLQQQYKGGSLPNVNQMATSSSIDLQTALQHLEDIRSGSQMPNRMDSRMHMRDNRGRQLGPHRRALPIDKQRTDCSPYGSPYLPLPPDPSSWRRLFRHVNGSIPRTNSDSALHTSANMGNQMNTELENLQSPTTPPSHRRIQEMVGDSSLDGMRKGYWDPKQLAQSRPKSCEVPNINIYPSAEQENQSGVHVPITNNTGSLPDLTVLHFPPPLATPLDAEDQNYPQGTPANLSPTHAHQMGIVHATGPGSPQAQSPAQRRRPLGGPSPLVLSSSPSQQMRLPAAHSPPVSVPNIDPSNRPLDPRYLLYMQQRQRVPNCHPQHIAPPHGGGVTPQMPSPPANHQNHSIIQSSPPAGQQQRLPQVCITSPEQNESQPSISHYRNNVSEGNCQSPTSPHSQTSYSPAQSPGLPPSNWNNSPFTDNYQLQQQQQQTQALQHQFEQFNMSQDNHFITTSDTTANGVSCGVYTSHHNSVNFSQTPMHGITSNHEYPQQIPQQYFNPQLDMNSVNSSQSRVVNQAQHPQSPHGNHQNNKIPDIIFTGVDDSHKHHEFNLSKDLGNAIMTDSFDTDDLFPGDEALKLGQLDLDGLQIQQMLNDPNMIADPATEESFKLDRL